MGQLHGMREFLEVQGPSDSDSDSASNPYSGPYISIAG
jgi:hypothetical protein